MIELEKIGFKYTIEHVGVDGNIKSTEVVENIIPLAGINYMLSAAMTGGAQFTNWYIGLFTANRTPITADTMASFLADCAETNAYGASRLSANLPSVLDGVISSVANPTVFTFASAATIQGGFITSGFTINNTSGLLISAVKFSSPKVISAGELLRVPVGLALASV